MEELGRRSCHSSALPAPELGAGCCSCNEAGPTAHHAASHQHPTRLQPGNKPLSAAWEPPPGPGGACCAPVRAPPLRLHTLQCARLDTCGCHASWPGKALPALASSPRCLEDHLRGLSTALSLGTLCIFFSVSQEDLRAHLVVEEALERLQPTGTRQLCPEVYWLGGVTKAQQEWFLRPVVCARSAHGSTRPPAGASTVGALATWVECPASPSPERLLVTSRAASILAIFIFPLWKGSFRARPPAP